MQSSLTEFFWMTPTTAYNVFSLPACATDHRLPLVVSCGRTGTVSLAHWLNAVAHETGAVAEHEPPGSAEIFVIQKNFPRVADALLAWQTRWLCRRHVARTTVVLNPLLGGALQRPVAHELFHPVVGLIRQPIPWAVSMRRFGASSRLRTFVVNRFSLARPQPDPDLFNQLRDAFPCEDTMFLRLLAAWELYAKTLRQCFPGMPVLAYEDLFGENGLNAQIMSIEALLEILGAAVSPRFSALDPRRTSRNLSATFRNQSGSGFTPSDSDALARFLDARLTHVPTARKLSTL